MTNNSAIIHVSRALKMHGMVHLEDSPLDEYDCCAEIAIEAYKSWIFTEDKKNKKKKGELVSDLLN